MSATKETRGPEWWTTENTAAWMAEVWGGTAEQSEAQRTWGGKMNGAAKAGAACYRPIPAETMAKWRESDPRPSATHYYDGRPIVYKAIAPKVRKPRARKAVAV